MLICLGKAASSPSVTTLIFSLSFMYLPANSAVTLTNDWYIRRLLRITTATTTSTDLKGTRIFTGPAAEKVRPQILHTAASMGLGVLPKVSTPLT